ncbi:hypothetical protein OVA00_36580 [Ensifer sp. SL37]|nr:ParB-like protein [Ensifer sp. SL37]MCY1745808.1 hypothetical protein [Ensifer sp. SL37]
MFDLSHLSKDEFWSVMDHRHWMYPLQRVHVGKLPALAHRCETHRQ